MTIRKTKSQILWLFEDEYDKKSLIQKAESYLFYRNIRSTVLNRSKYGKTYLLPFKYIYSRYIKRKTQHVFNVFTQVGVKQLTDFLRTVTAASNLVDCTLVNCADLKEEFSYIFYTFFKNLPEMKENPP